MRRLRASVAKFRACLGDVPRLGRRVLILRAGLDDRRPLSRRQVARRLDLSRTRVARLERRSLRVLRRAARSHACARPAAEHDATRTGLAHAAGGALPALFSSSPGAAGFAAAGPLPLARGAPHGPAAQPEEGEEPGGLADGGARRPEIPIGPLDTTASDRPSEGRSFLALIGILLAIVVLLRLATGPRSES